MLDLEDLTRISTFFMCQESIIASRWKVAITNTRLGG